MEVLEKFFSDDRNSDEVNGLEFRHQIVHYLPSGMDKIFKHLEGIAIEACRLQKITKLDLQPFPNLKELRITKNYQLNTLEENLFMYNEQLLLIDFSNNDLQHIHCQILVPLVNLEYAYLNSNKPRINQQATTQSEIAFMKLNFAKNCFNGNQDVSRCQYLFIFNLIVVLFLFGMLILFLATP